MLLVSTIVLGFTRFLLVIMMEVIFWLSFKWFMTFKRPTQKTQLYTLENSHDNEQNTFKDVSPIKTALRITWPCNKEKGLDVFFFRRGLGGISSSHRWLETPMILRVVIFQPWLWGDKGTTAEAGHTLEGGWVGRHVASYYNQGVGSRNTLEIKTGNDMTYQGNLGSLNS